MRNTSKADRGLKGFIDLQNGTEKNRRVAAMLELAITTGLGLQGMKDFPTAILILLLSIPVWIKENGRKNGTPPVKTATSKAYTPFAGAT